MKYRKKPVVVEAVQWFKHGSHPAVTKHPNNYLRKEYQIKCRYDGMPLGTHGEIQTLEGIFTVCPGDWIITGIKGEHYPCKPDIFEITYEPVEE